MARKNQHTFGKRQRERKKAEKAAEKRARRDARKDPEAPTEGSTEGHLDELSPDAETPHAEVAEDAEAVTSEPREPKPVDADKQDPS